MLAAICRRRLAVLFSQIPGGSRGVYPLQSNPQAVLHSHSYSSTALAGGPGSKPCPDTIAYLVSCGLSPATAARVVATTRNLRIRSTEKAGAVCTLLRSYGFSDGDIARTVRSAPLVLTIDAERIIRPKLEFFASLGFEPRVLASTPLLLGRSLSNHIIPSIQFLRGIIGSDDMICYGLSRQPRALCANLDKYMRPAVETLRRHGLTKKDISKVLVTQMAVLMLSPRRIGEIFEDFKAVGMSITDSRFPNCFRAMCCMKRETWQRKVAFYRSFGLSEGTVFEAFRKQPTMMLISEETAKRKFTFFLDELRLEINDLVAQPVILAYSLEKTIMPRCAVLNVLMREGKIKTDIKLLQALIGSNKFFSSRFVSRYAEDVPDAVHAYEGKIKFEGLKRRVA